jgi:hypothetical protein
MRFRDKAMIGRFRLWWEKIGGNLSSSQNQPGATSGALYGNAPYLHAPPPNAINLHQLDLHAIRLPGHLSDRSHRLGLSCRCALRHGLPLPYDERHFHRAPP